MEDIQNTVAEQKKEIASAQVTLDGANNLKGFIECKKADVEGELALAMPKVQEILEKTLEKVDEMD